MRAQPVMRARHHWPMHITSIIIVVLVSFLTACGGGGGSDGATQVTTSGAAVAAVEIDQTGLVLTELGDTSQLSATAYDDQGNALAVPISWSSTTPADIGVDSTGLVTANTTTGSTQIVAEANGVRSAPLLVVATVLPAGAIELTDAQIVGEPFIGDSVAAASVVTSSDIDLDTPASFDNTYQVVLTGIDPPAIGSLLISTGSKVVAGRVVAVEVNGNQMTVTLGLASLRELFPNLSIEQVIDMANAEVSLPPDIAALYDVERVGDSYTFTPKPAGNAADIAFVKPAAVATPIGTHALPPFSECATSLTGAGGALPISLSTPPLFSVTATPTLDMLVTPGNGLERFLVKAEPTIKFEGGVTVTAAFEGKVECSVDLFIWRIPVGGALSFVFGGVVPIGVGMEVGGKVTVATAGLGTDVTLSSKAQVGLLCPDGSNCESIGSWGDFTAKVNPKLDAPSLGDLRFEPSVFAFGRLELQIGNPFLKKLRFEAFKAKAGGKLQGSFAPQASQIADTGYKSDYKASVELTADVGLELGEVIKLLGLASANALQFSVTKDLGTSPTGTVTADRASFVNGDTVNFKVTLDPNAIEFIPGVGPYNVKEVVLVRSVPGDLVPTEIARVSASGGQTEFSIPFNATDSGAAQEFTAFLVTALVPFDVFVLEVGSPLSSQWATIKKDGTRVSWSVWDEDENLLCCSDVLLSADMPPPISLAQGNVSLSVYELSTNMLAFDISGSSSVDPSGASEDGLALVRTELQLNRSGTLKIDIGPAWSGPESAFWQLDATMNGPGCTTVGCQPSTSITIAEPGMHTLDVGMAWNGGTASGGRAVTITFTPSP